MIKYQQMFWCVKYEKLLKKVVKICYIQNVIKVYPPYLVHEIQVQR